MTEEIGIMEIRIDGMDCITGTELQRIIDSVSGDWDYEAWYFDGGMDRIEFPSCTSGDAVEMAETLEKDVPEELRARACLSVRWWTYDERDEGLEARVNWGVRR